MKIYYVVLPTGRVVGCKTRSKLEAMHPGCKIKECCISDFDGHLYSAEWH